ncbi:virginiamycin B lyase, partial [Streptomyces albidoflavus]
MQPADSPAVTEIAVAEGQDGPYGITTGPDGALWLTFVRSGRIARFTL